MSYGKSDILFLGVDRHSSSDGTLTISFEGGPSSADLFVLRDVLALFGAEVVGEGVGYRSVGDQCCPIASRTGYVTTLPFSELAKLDGADSFPHLQTKRDSAIADEAARKARLKAAEQADKDRQATAVAERNAKRAQFNSAIA